MTQQDTDDEMVLTDLSPEVLHSILSFLDTSSLGPVSQTCRFLRDFVARDDLLWRRHYLRTYDEPRTTPPSWAQSTKDLIKMDKILRSTNYDLKRSSLSFIGPLIVSMLLHTKSQPTLNTAHLDKHFHHDSRRSNVSTLLRQSTLFRHCGLPYDEPADTVQLQQLSAHLHVLYGLEAEVRPSELLMDYEGPFADVDANADEAALDREAAIAPLVREIHPYARSRVYDLRRYKPRNNWGPFMDDGSGRVDWEKVQSIFIVLSHGLRMLSERAPGRIAPFWHRPWNGVATDSYGARRAELHAEIAGNSVEPEDPDSIDWFERYSDPREARFQAEQARLDKLDPYGVRGTWMRVVNFLDYHDLFGFNFQGSALEDDVERGPVTTTEAFRLILLKLWVTKIEWLDPDEPDPAVDESRIADVPPSSSSALSGALLGPAPALLGDTREPMCKKCRHHNCAHSRGSTDRKFPVVYFAGKSRSMHIRWDPNAKSHIRGYARTTPHGDIRWTTFSVFHGEERWRSEGIQIGGAKSERGILGNWFDKDYDQHGPAGPTAFWKMGDGFEMYTGGQRGPMPWDVNEEDSESSDEEGEGEEEQGEDGDDEGGNGDGGTDEVD